MWDSTPRERFPPAESPPREMFEAGMLWGALSRVETKATASRSWVG